MAELKEWLVAGGIDSAAAALVAALLALLLLVAVSVTAHYLTKRVVLRLVRAAAHRTRTAWDDALVEANVFSRLSHLVPAIIIHAAAPLALRDYPQAESMVTTATFVYIALVGMTVLDALLNGLLAIYRRYEVAERIPIKTLVQVVKVIVYTLGGIAVVAILFGKSPLVFLSGMGAFTAILLLIFKDAILGLVAGVQLSANDMVRRGDWIEMPGQNADGDVIDVNLTTVKVQNWDKTITTIPTYALVAESFKNWRGMSESGGRRIKRSVNIDMASIMFCDREMLTRFRRIQFIAEYVERKLEEVSRHNQRQGADISLLINGRHLTNVGTFRAYLEAYLRNHPKIHDDMTFLVRQLQPTDRGLPIEVYVFSNDQVWPRFEAIQADIFDHILAVIPLFDLRVFQAPGGADLRALAAGSSIP
ncbi:MAG: mechanosensitive ion channel [bacterium]|nr:mechanosensitive ion channel [bacterium]